MRFAHLWYDTRVRALLTQVLLLALVLGGFAWLVSNTVTNLAARGMNIDFGFFGQAARFPLSETLIPYTPADSFARAFLAGLLNTLMVAVIVIALATVLGFALGAARRSAHPLLAGTARVYIEVIRNTPLIVHVLFWYIALITTLPPVRQAWDPLPGVYLTVRGIFLPSLGLSGMGLLFPLAAVLVVATLLVLGLYRPARRHLTGLPRLATPLIAIAILGAAWLLEGLTLRVEAPELAGLNFRGGLRITPEFAALVVSLVSYKIAFIAEIFRGGIDAVDRGQWEAARALGVKEREVLWRIILPQALRIIVPPMASQYLTAVKNTTVALAIGYPDFSAVVGTMINQSGRALEGIAVMMAVYLTISLSVATFMNWYNSRVSRRGKA